MEKETIINHLLGLKKKEVIAYMGAAWETMTEMQRRSVFGDLYEQLMFESLTPLEHFEAIEVFYNDSIAKKYYAPFDMNSKNFNHIPAKTDIWFDTISGLLDRTCDWVNKGEKDIAVKSFKLLFELIRRMEYGEDIVFAHELGDWMITAKQDYQKVYKTLQANL